MPQVSHTSWRANLCVAQGLSRGANWEGPSEGSMHLAQVIPNKVPHPGALALVMHLAQLAEGFHLHHHQHMHAVSSIWAHATRSLPPGAGLL